ncbi:MAG: TMEM14 family protein [Parachlamydiales bacterium]|jgi:uncharacterized membrane protein (UPF0136 family)
MNSLKPLVILLYTVLLFVGGIIGFAKTGSYISIITATSFTLLLLLSLWAARSGYRWGMPLTWTCLLLLTAFFGYRFSLTGAFMPAGLMLILGAVTIGFLFYKGNNPLLKDT